MPNGVHNFVLDKTSAGKFEDHRRSTGAAIGAGLRIEDWYRRARLLSSWKSDCGGEMENEMGRPEMFPLGAVPLSVLTVILSLTSALDVTRLAMVNRTFAKAAKADWIWRKFLPYGVDEIVQNAYGRPLTYGSRKALYERLVNYVLLRKGTEGYWIDRKTSGVCRSYSARAMGITWGENKSYWKWLPHQGSRFGIVAYLHNVCWLGVSGEFKCRLPPGTYSFSWVLKFDDEAHGWEHGPVKVALTDGTMNNLFDATFPLSAESSCRQTNDGWLEYDVGQFVVEKRSRPQRIAGNMGMHLAVHGALSDFGQWIEATRCCPHS